MTETAKTDAVLELYSYTNMARTRANIRLRMVAFRTFCGAVCTLVSSIAYDSRQNSVPD